MTKILFVCLGNICRSPMAEFVFKDLLIKNKKQKEFFIDSAATSTEEIGNSMHYGTIEKLKEKGIKYTDHRAKQIEAKDYEEYDYIIGMENRNIRDILTIVGEDTKHKIFRLLDFSDRPRDIADPWFTGNFDITYKDILEGCNALLNKITNN